MHIFSQLCPQFTGSGPAVCAKSHVARRERSPEKRGRKEEGGVGGTRSRTQEVEKDEEPGDNVMHRGAELGRGRRGREGKASKRRERRQRKNVGRGGGESSRGRAGCVHLALGGRER